MVGLRVPATSANLGPGFDCLGVALALWMRCSFPPRGDGRLVISGCPDAYRNQDNLVYRAYRLGCDSLGLPHQGLDLHIDSQIPPSRGLGSSAAAAVAGLAGAFVLHTGELPKERILRLAAGLEGHPDNAAPAVWGGLRASLALPDGTLLSRAFPLSAQWLWTALVPPFPLATQAARAALPHAVPVEDAVYNLSRTPLLLAALQDGDAALLEATMRDRLHQHARLPLIQDGLAVWEAAHQAGAVVYLSGAGPTLMCLHMEQGLRARLSALLPAGWRMLPLEVDRQGVIVE